MLSAPLSLRGGVSTDSRGTLHSHDPFYRVVVCVPSVEASKIAFREDGAVTGSVSASRYTTARTVGRADVARAGVAEPSRAILEGSTGGCHRAGEAGMSTLEEDLIDALWHIAVLVALVDALK